MHCFDNKNFLVNNKNFLVNNKILLINRLDQWQHAFYQKEDLKLKFMR